MFLDVVDRCLASCRTEEAPEQTAFGFSADVGGDRVLRGGKVARGIHSLYVGCLRVFRGRELEEMCGSLLATMRDLACSVQNEFLRLRAGGVVFGDRALLLPSPPEPRLAALVAFLVRRGGRYLGDEMVKVDPVLCRVHPVRLPILLDVWDGALFPELGGHVWANGSSRRARSAFASRRAVTLVELGGTEAGPSEIGWVAFPRFDPGAVTRIGDIGPSEAVFRLAEAGLNLHVWGERGLRLMRTLMEEARVSEVIIGSVEEGAEVLASIAGVRAGA